MSGDSAAAPISEWQLLKLRDCSAKQLYMLDKVGVDWF